jgi:hypothetical protein
VVQRSILIRDRHAAPAQRGDDLVGDGIARDREPAAGQQALGA